MKTMNRIISFVCALTMVFSMCAVTSFASPVEDNWDTMCAKYSSRAKTIIADKNTGVIKTTGFTFTADENNGLKVVTPSYKEFAGVYPVSAVTSKYKTSLDGASVTIRPDEMTMQKDTGNNISSKFSIVFSEERLTALASDYRDNAFRDGLASYEQLATNGLRQALPNGSKSIVVTISNGYGKYENDMRASSLSITYYDGSYINVDTHKGYRWSFTARNYTAESPDADTSPIVQRYENIDLSNGLTVSLRADKDHGYIVNVNGKDYYKGLDIAYFPDCSVARFNGTSDEPSFRLSNPDYTNKSEYYLKSMTKARADIDLRQFADSVKEGYITVGVAGNGDTNNPCNYTITEINTHPAATWKGESACDHSNVSDWTETKAATCGADGTRVKTCLDCGVVVETETIPATGNHTPGEYKVTLEPTCNKVGKEVQKCTVCGNTLDTRDIPIDENAHVKEWKITKEPTCTAEGEKQEICKVCDKVFATETIEKIDHVKEWKTTKEATCTAEGEKQEVCKFCGEVFATETIEKIAHAKEWKITKEPTCTAEGEKQEVCKVCGEVFATETVEKAEHTPSKEWKVTEAEHPYLEEGKRELLCTVCGEVLKTEVIPVKEYVKPTDVVASWYESQVEYCVKHGLMTGMSGTEFGVNSSLTRDQFILILARLANVDENAYKGGDIGFGDVPADHWGAWAIKWAHDEEITAGVGNGNFGVGQSLVREQFAVLIYSYMDKVGKDIKIDDEAIANFRKYEDINNVSSWAVDGVTWAMSKGIIGSMVTERFVFSPKSNVTRAQAAVMIRNIHSDGLFD